MGNKEVPSSHQMGIQRHAEEHQGGQRADDRRVEELEGQTGLE